MPHSFSVVRGRSGEVAGYNSLIVVDPSTNRLQFDDPITRIWWRYLQANPIPKRQLALFVPKYLGAENGDGFHPVLGPLLLDLKRTYLEHPRSRVVFALEHTQDWIPFNEQLGFRILDWITLDGKSYYTSVNDFGSQLVPGWLAGLVDSETGLAPSVVLNVEARELLMENTRISLTPLEFQLMQYLCQREGNAVSRDDLLNEVWGYSYDGGSNVVDRIVRSLRKKLGDHAKSIETVSGVGYKLRWGK